MSEWQMNRESLEFVGKFLKFFAKDGHLVIRDGVLSCIVVDLANVAIAEVQVDVDGDDPGEFKVDFDALNKAVGMSKAKGLMLSIDSGIMQLVVGKHVLKIRELGILSSTVKKVPQLEYDVKVEVDSKEMLDMLAGVVASLDNKVMIVLDGRRLSVSVESNLLHAMYEEEVGVDGSVVVGIPSDYLQDIAKGLKGKCDRLVFEMQTDSPLIVEADIPDGRVRVMIAPRIEK